MGETEGKAVVQGVKGSENVGKKYGRGISSIRPSIVAS